MRGEMDTKTNQCRTSARGEHLFKGERADMELHLVQEVQNIPFCPLQEKVHAVVLKGVRNISGAR